MRTLALCRSLRLSHRRTYTMITEILPVDSKHFQFIPSSGKFASQNARSIIENEHDQAAIAKAVELLRQDEAISMPTETVYGLAANALSEKAVAKIFKAKNRPQDNPLIVHVSSIEMLQTLLPNKTIPPVYLPVIEHCWPGALTIILPTSSLIPSSVTCQLSTVGVRFPSHPVARALIEACGFPLAAPSANSSGKPSPTRASHVFDDLQGKIPLILDGGSCPVGVESTVLDALRSPPAILRPGGVTFEELRELPGLNHLQVYSKHFVDKALEEAPTTPGMKYRHYSPNAKTVLIEYHDDQSNTAFTHRWQQELKSLQSTHPDIRKVGILTLGTESLPNEETTLTVDNAECIVMKMGRADHPDEVARNMFHGLRDMDARHVDVIFVQGIPESREGMAVMNRLRKAASTVLE